MSARWLLFIRPLFIAGFVGLLVFSSYRFYTQTQPPSDPILRSVYRVLHGTTRGSSPPGTWRYPIQYVNLGTAYGYPVRYSVLRSFTFSNEATDIDITFQSSSEATLPTVRDLTAAALIEMDGRLYSVNSVSTSAETPQRIEATLHFPGLPARLEALDITLNGGLTFHVPDRDLPQGDGALDGENVWGYLIFFSAYVLLLAWIRTFRRATGTRRYLDGVLHEWRLFDDERRLAAERCGLQDDPATQAQRRIAANACLDRSENVILGYYQQALNSQLIATASLLLAIGAAICAAFVIPTISSAPLSFFAGGLATAPVVPLAQRIDALEATRPMPTLVLVTCIAVGLTAIAANYFGSYWRAKQTARQFITSRLTRFDSQLQTTISREMIPSAGVLRMVDQGLRGMSSSLEEQIREFDMARHAAIETTHATAASIVSQARQHARALTSRLRKDAKASARSAA